MPLVRTTKHDPILDIHFALGEDVLAKSNGDSGYYIQCCGTTVFLKKEHAAAIHKQLGKALGIESIEDVAADQTAIGPPVDVEAPA